jgi:osmoprotectant transport system permease protein
VAEGDRVTALASVGSEFSDAIEFLFEERESVSGGVQVGGFDEILDLTATHMELSFLAVLIACLVGVPLGLWLGHIGRGEFVAVSVSNIGRAVPTLALIAFFIAYLGVGFTNVLVALVLLAIPPILTNTYVGVRQANPEVVDAARGVGLSEAQIARQVELPLALSPIFGGIRISAVNVIATAIIAPLASVNTLGTPIISANVYGDAGRLGASIAVAVIAITVDAALAGVQRATTPKGLKLAEERNSSGRRRLSTLFLRRREQAT